MSNLYLIIVLFYQSNFGITIIFNEKKIKRINNSKCESLYTRSI